MPGGVTRVICDLGGIFIKTNAWRAARILGITNSFIYFILMRKTPDDLKRVLYRILSVIPSHRGIVGARDESGDTIPGIMCDWFCGSVAGTDIIRRVEELIDDPANLERFAMHSATERTLVLRLAHLIFDPELFTSTRQLVPGSVELITWMRAQGLELYLLSNWDLWSFTLLREKYPQFFGQFSELVISANIGFMKPDPRTYVYFLQKDPHHSLYLDDQVENLKPADDSGMKTVLCHKKLGWLHLREWPDLERVREDMSGIIGISGQNPD